jgi:hypothetical protein
MRPGRRHRRAMRGVVVRLRTRPGCHRCHVTRRVVVRLRTRPWCRRRCATRCVNSSCARAHCFCNMKLVRMHTRGVTPRKRNKAAQNRDNRRKERAGNVSDDKAEPAPLGVERAQRSAKKAEAKGRAPSAANAGHMAVWAGAKAKAIKEIDSEQSEDEGAQARMGANRAGKTPKRPRTKRRALTPVKGWAARLPGRRLR